MNLRPLPAAALALTLVAAPAHAAKPKRADLTSSKLKAPAAVKAGDSFTATAKAANSGTATAVKTTFALLLSKDGKADKSDAVVGTATLKALKKGRSVTVSIKGKVPAGAKAGSYKLLGCADRGGKVKEGSETNNCTSKALTVSAAAVSSGPNVTPIPLTSGAQATEDGTVGITLQASDANDCDLTFAVVQQPAHGTLGAPQPAACTKGSPNQDAVTFPYTPAANFNGADTLIYTVTDGHSAPVTSTVAISVASVLDAPVITSLPNVSSATEDTWTPIPFGLSWPESGGLSISVKADKGWIGIDQSQSYVINQGGKADGSTHEITYDLNNEKGAKLALSQLIYRPNGNDASTDTITVTVRDYKAQGQPSDTKSFNVAITPVNDRPEIFRQDMAYSAKNSSMVFSIGGCFEDYCPSYLHLRDYDAGNADVEATVTVTHGVYSLKTTNGLSFTVGDGTQDTTMTFRGTIAEINAAFLYSTFKPDMDFSGDADFTVHVDDLGNSGPGGAKTADLAQKITVGS